VRAEKKCCAPHKPAGNLLVELKLLKKGSEGKVSKVQEKETRHLGLGNVDKGRPFQREKKTYIIRGVLGIRH